MERVLLLSPGALLDLLACGAYDGLDLSAVDKTSDVGVGNLCGGETIYEFQYESAREMKMGLACNLSCIQQPYRMCQRPRQEARMHLPSN